MVERNYEEYNHVVLFFALRKDSLTVLMFAAATVEQAVS